eukprot:1167005-Rhodomonas_salina.1
MLRCSEPCVVCRDHHSGPSHPLRQCRGSRHERVRTGGLSRRSECVRHGLPRGVRRYSPLLVFKLTAQCARSQHQCSSYSRVRRQEGRRTRLRTATSCICMPCLLRLSSKSAAEDDAVPATSSAASSAFSFKPVHSSDSSSWRVADTALFVPLTVTKLFAPADTSASRAANTPSSPVSAEIRSSSAE